MRIAIVGKYVELHDAYLSIKEALIHSSVFHGARLDLEWIHSEHLEDRPPEEVIGEVDDMKPYENDGAYLNFAGFGEEGEDQLKTAYGANYTRLKAIKATYDPNNLFRSNLYILPAA